ncbi:MGMT family protein [Planococcus sp. FY231025]|uniref:MGMT family protein n=1 Tax=Planococcus sp. FY231025 TaxID=3455699 RepID=UPI003F91CFD9
MQPFTEKAISTIKAIPPGKVMTYGQVAACAGSPRGGRQVARLLHSMSSKYDLPWHRVVNAQGQIMIQDPEARFAQQTFLQQEGVEVSMNGKIDLSRFNFHPADE